MAITQQGLIETPEDFIRLPVVDWYRANGLGPMFPVPEYLGRIIAGAFTCTVYEHDLSVYPLSDDFPDWKHPGAHVELARQYWSFFQQRNPHSSLYLGDAPDFGGVFQEQGLKANFWGDFGLVGIYAFIDAINGMQQGDLWITVLDMQTQIILQAQENWPLRREQIMSGMYRKN